MDSFDIDELAKYQKPYKEFEPDHTWKKECPVCIQAKSFEQVSKFRFNIEVVDKRDDTVKIWSAPKHLVREIHEAREFVIDEALANISKWRRFWCKIFKRPLLKDDPMANKVFEINREERGMFSIYSVKVKAL